MRRMRGAVRSLMVMMWLALAAMWPAAAQCVSMVYRHRVELTPGLNAVALPIRVGPDAARRADQLLAEILPAVKSMWWYDATAQQWQVFCPAAMDTPPVLPEHAGIVLDMAAAAEWAVAGTLPAVGATGLPPLEEGWNLVGFGHAARAADGHLAPAALTWRQLTALSPDLDLLLDTVWSAGGGEEPPARLWAESVLEPGRAYWIAKRSPVADRTSSSAPPLLTADAPVAEAAGSTLVQRAAALAELRQDIADQDDDFPEPAGDLKLGRFTITDVHYQRGADLQPSCGVGILANLPAELGGVLAVNDDLPILVHLDYRNGELTAAYAEGPVLSDDGFSGACYLVPERRGDGSIGGWQANVAGDDILYLMLYVSDFYPDGILHVETESSCPIQPGDAGGYVRFHTSSGAERDSKTDKAKANTPFDWVQRAYLYGQPEEGVESDVVVSRVWRQDGDRIVAVHAEDRWLLRLPADAEGVFEPGRADSNAAYGEPFGEDPRAWLPVYSSQTGDVNFSAHLCADTVAFVRMLHHPLLGIDAVNRGYDDACLDVDLFGNLSYRIEEAAVVRYRQGRLEFSGPNASALCVYFVIPRGMLGVKVGVRAELPPGQYALPVEECSADVVFGAGVMPQMQACYQQRRQQNYYASMWSSLLKGLAEVVKFRLGRWGGAPNDEAFAMWSGSEFSFAAEARFKTDDRNDTLVVDMGIAFSYCEYVARTAKIQSETCLHVSYLSEILGSTHLDADLVVRRYGTRTSAAAVPEYEDYVNEFFRVAVNTGGEGGNDAWCGKTVTVEDSVIMKSDKYARGAADVVYTCSPMVMLQIAEADGARLGDEGWNFAVEEVRCMLQPFPITLDKDDGFLANTVFGLVEYVKTRYSKRPGTNNLQCWYLDKATTTCTLTMPPSLHEVWGNLGFSLELDWPEGGHLFTKPHRILAMTQTNLGLLPGVDDLEIRLREIFVLREYVGNYPGAKKPWCTNLAVTVDILTGNQQTTCQGLVHWETNGDVSLTLIASNIPAITGHLDFARVDTVMVTLPLKIAGRSPNSAEFWHGLSVTVSGAIDSAEIRENLGLEKGITIAGSISFPGSGPSSATLTAYAGGIPLQSQDALTNDLSSMPGVKFEKIRNLMLTLSRSPATFAVAFDVDLIFDSFVPDEDKENPAAWPRTTLGGSFSWRRENGLRRIDIEGHAANLVYNMKDDGQLALDQFYVRYSRVGSAGSWDVGGTVHFRMPATWRDFLADAQIDLGESLALTLRYDTVGTRTGWFFSAVFNQTLELGNFALQLNGVTVTKCSPWGLILNATVIPPGGGGQQGEVGLLRDGLEFQLPGDQAFSLSLGDFDLTVSNFSIGVASNWYVGGNVHLELPSGCVLDTFLGRELNGQLRVNPSQFAVTFAVDKGSSVDLGPLGEAGLAMQSLTLSSDGFFSGAGVLTVAGHRLGLVLGVDKGNLRFLVDFGSGVSIGAGPLFDLNVRDKVGFRTMFGYSVVEVADVAVGFGPRPYFGADYAARDLWYFLPSSVPPVGFAFFDPFEGETYMFGFGIHSSMSFPHPSGEEVLALAQLLLKALSGSATAADLEALENFNCPSFSIRDVYLDFPKIPGYAWEDGGFRRVDSIFAAIFHRDQLPLLPDIRLGPRTLVGLARADNAFDVVDAFIPPDCRQGELALDLRGFKVGASYELREPRSTGYDDQPVPGLGDLYRFVEGVRYVDLHCGAAPDFLNATGTTVAAWYGSDSAVLHTVGYQGHGRCWLTDMTESRAGRPIAGLLAASPPRALPAGGYRGMAEMAVYQGSRDLAVTFEAVSDSGRTVWAKRELAGQDFWLAAPGITTTWNPRDYQAFAVEFSLPEEVPDLQLRVTTTGRNYVSTQRLELLAACEPDVREVVLPAELGGDVARVTWQAADLRTELAELDSIMAALKPPAGQTWQRYFAYVWEQLCERCDPPNPTTNRLRFAWSPRWMLELEVSEYREGYDVNMIRFQDDQMQAVFGLTTLFGGTYEDAGMGQHLLAVRDLADATAASELVSNEFRAANGFRSVRIADRGLVRVYSGRNFTGDSADLRQSTGRLEKAGIGGGVGLSARIWFPIENLDDISKWRLICRSPSGIEAIIDGGALDVRLPNHERLLWLHEDAQVAAACRETGVALADLDLWSDFFKAPGQYVQRFYAEHVAPQAVRAHVQVSGNTSLNLPVNPAMFAPDGSVDVTLDQGWYSFRPQGHTDGGTVTGLRFDPAAATMAAKRGKVILYDNLNCEGDGYEVTDDTPILLAVGMSDRVSSIEIIDGGRAALYDQSYYTRAPELTPVGFTSDAITFDATAIAELVERISATTCVTHVPGPGGGGGPPVGPITPITPIRPITPITRVLPGDDEAGVNTRLDDRAPRDPEVPPIGGEPVVLYTGNLGPWGPGTCLVTLPSTTVYLGRTAPPEGTPLLELRVTHPSLPGGAATARLDRDKLMTEPDANGQYQATITRSLTLDMKFDTAGDLGVQVTILRYTDVEYVFNPLKYGISRWEPNEIITQTDMSLYDNPVHNNCLRSIKVYFPLTAAECREYQILRTLTARGLVAAVCAENAQGNLESTVGVRLEGTANRIKLRYTDDGLEEIRATTEDGFVYPRSGGLLYLPSGPLPVAALADAADYVHLITRSIDMPGPIRVTDSAGGAIRAVVGSTAIEALNEYSDSSTFTLVSAEGTPASFDFPREVGGFSYGRIVGSNPQQYVPVYRDEANRPAGIRLPLGGDPGGFIITAGLDVGVESVLELDAAISGTIQTDGNFRLEGDGSLTIAGHTVSEVKIILSTAEGLYVRGKMDLFGVGKAEIEGYLRPDGQFAFRGAASAKVAGTGIEGTVIVDNDGMLVKGALMLCDHKVTSGTFEIDGGTVTYESSLSIGIAGIDYGFWINLQNNCGAGIYADIWVDVAVPIEIWGPRDFDCCCWGCICYPSDWGWIKVGEIEVHRDVHLAQEVTGDKISTSLGIVDVVFDIDDRSLSVDW